METNTNTVTMPRIVSINTTNLLRRKPRQGGQTLARIEMLRNAHKDGKQLAFGSRKDAMPFLMLPRQFNETIVLDHGENPDGKAGECFFVWPSKAIPAKLTRKVAVKASKASKAS